MNLFFKSLIVPKYFFTLQFRTEFIALACTTGKNKNNCTSECQQLLMGGRILMDIKGEFSWTKWVNSCGHFW